MYGSSAMERHWDWIVIGSGFGGSVSALRLAEKGYRVLVLEKGKRFAPKDFAKSNRDVKRWMWRPELGMQGIFQMTFLPHVTILHGVGVGGGSLTYANTLPTPKAPFFATGSWAKLADWRQELEPHYQTARRMLGSAPNPRETRGDRVLREIAQEIGKEEHFHNTDVAVFFGEPGKKVADPYFGGEGPDRVGCTYCGACMTGCQVGAKNTLDRNYLYLAEKRGTHIEPETEVLAVRPQSGGGYLVETKRSFGSREERAFTADQVVFSGGVMGTIPLLLKMKQDPAGLPKLSDQTGYSVRTNSESLIGITAPDGGEDFHHGVAITSILETDEHSHIEPVRYGAGSDFFRYLTLPHAPGANALQRLAGTVRAYLKEPQYITSWFRSLDYSRRTQIMLYMRSLEGSLRLKLGRGLFTGFLPGLVSELSPGNEPPSAFIPEATELANRFAEKVKGVTLTIFSETLGGIPTTAHILGGACIGASSRDGVIDTQHRVFGYDGLYVIDGSAMSANPGVNPSLTITAMAERAMSFIPPKSNVAA